MSKSFADVISEKAVEPLERTAEWEAGEVEETFPSGL
jgi:hypothetical protein